MATRHNACQNPSLSVSDAGWGDGGAGVPARTAVSDFPRAFAARFTDGASFHQTPVGAAVAGTTYTASLYIRSASLPIGSGVLYFRWMNAAMGDISFPSTAFTTSAGVVTRISITGVAPANTAFVRLILDGWSTTTNTTDMTAILYEASGSLADFFDGDTTPGGSWDGTTGLSASTLTSTVTGTASVVLGALVAAASGVRSVGGAAVVSLGALAGAAVGVRTVQGSAVASLPGPTAVAVGVRTVSGVAVGSLGGLTATGSGSAPATSSAGGSWYGLLDIFREAAQIAADERSRPPVACPNDGQPLEHARGVLHCPYDGWIDDGSGW